MSGLGFVPKTRNIPASRPVLALPVGQACDPEAISWLLSHDVIQTSFSAIMSTAACAGPKSARVHNVAVYEALL
ncbi:hypothetical protein JCM31598_19520 [Desulfonatronum parangueonense]